MFLIILINNSHRALQQITLDAGWKVMSFTQENTTDPHSAVKSPLILASTDARKIIYPVKNMSIYYCMAFFPLVAMSYVFPL